MEKINVYTVQDLKAQQWLEPMCMTEFQVDEWLFSAVNDLKTDWNKYSSDFVLFEMGSFDPISGELLLTTKKALRSLSSYKKQEA
ncbi:hypothetical protein [Microviridae sp.]|nr:hypothetical protein [Microviridae sp.]